MNSERVALIPSEIWHFLCSRLCREVSPARRDDPKATPAPLQVTEPGSHGSPTPTGLPGECFTNPEAQKGFKYLSVGLLPAGLPEALLEDCH